MLNQHTDISELIYSLTSIPLDGIDYLYFTGSTAFLSNEDHVNSILTTILQRILPNKTLIVPTFCFDFCDHGEYVVDSDSTYCGLFAKAILNFQGVQRTKWPPVHSFAVAGKETEHILSINSDVTFGRGSVFDFLAKSKTLVVLLGVNIDNSVAHFHYLEEMYGVSYRFLRKYNGIVKYGDEVISKKPFYRYVKKNNANVNSKSQSQSFQDSKFVTKTSSGMVTIRYFLLANYIDYFSVYFDKDKDFFLE